ncbi:YidC/Oxa1 family membrane protein insertase [Candidatus Peribacteria bacterium]|nr:MAG: YidC/Oxa1 family membrane protein insertase [Candidatus Peribacteria bacterium]
MAESKKRSSRLLDFAIAFALVYAIVQLVMYQFFPANKEGAPTGVQLQASNVRLGAGGVIVTIKNDTDQTFTLPSRCPQLPFDVFTVSGDTGNSTTTPVSASGTAIPCADIPVVEPIAPGDSAKVDLNPWKYSAFSKTGIYEIRLPEGSMLGDAEMTNGSGSAIMARFSVNEPNMFIKLFRSLITKPFLNFLILTASVIPGHNLGLGIIILTLIVKLLLFIPTQHALEGQKKMQLLQPKLEAVKKQYKDNPEQMQKETMRLWKEHGVNPLQSCLPILVQFPVLIGLFYVIRDGSNLALSKDLIYPVYQHLDWNFSTNFLGLDLTQPHMWIFPPLLVVLQFLQMWLSFKIADKKKAKQIEKAEAATGMELQQKVMLYALPLMIGYFALQFPSAVSLYWGISTLFAIGQQIIVNREHIKA